jgi:hypothetical protein
LTRAVRLVQTAFSAPEGGPSPTIEALTAFRNHIRLQWINNGSRRCKELRYSYLEILRIRYIIKIKIFIKIIIKTEFKFIVIVNYNNSSGTIVKNKNSIVIFRFNIRIIIFLKYSFIIK